jgi:hypothetical protein
VIWAVREGQVGRALSSSMRLLPPGSYVVSGWAVEATSGIDKSWTASIARGEQDRACPAPAVGRNTLCSCVLILYAHEIDGESELWWSRKGEDGLLVSDTKLLLGKLAFTGAGWSTSAISSVPSISAASPCTWGSVHHLSEVSQGVVVFCCLCSFWVNAS